MARTVSRVQNSRSTTVEILETYTEKVHEDGYRDVVLLVDYICRKFHTCRPSERPILIPPSASGIAPGGFSTFAHSDNRVAIGSRIPVPCLSSPRMQATHLLKRTGTGLAQMAMLWSLGQNQSIPHKCQLPFIHKTVR